MYLFDVHHSTDCGKLRAPAQSGRRIRGRRLPATSTSSWRTSGDVDVEGGAARRVVVHQVDQDRALGEQALGAGADGEDAWKEIQRASLGQHVARARAGDAERERASDTSVIAPWTSARAPRSALMRPPASSAGQVSSRWSGPSQSETSLTSHRSGG
jgi:hypothetical protein